MKLKNKDLLSIKDLSVDEMDMILETTTGFKEVSRRDIKKVPTLRGKTVINLFYEPSTRTRTSFEIAAKRMSADAINISVAQSSVKKGETFKDTALSLEAMRPDCIVVRHGESGAPQMIAKYLESSVVNGGDGAHEHPSQALLDIYTVREKFDTKSLKGLKVLIVGDAKYSRVARSNIYGFTKMGAEVTLCAPPMLLPVAVEKLGCKVSHHIMDNIKDADVVMMLRNQFERQEGSMFPSTREYAERFGLDSLKLKDAKKDVIVMHPGPINRGIEISSEVADSERSVILDQVENGVAVRMAIFYHLIGAASPSAKA